MELEAEANKVEIRYIFKWDQRREAIKTIAFIIQSNYE